MLAVHVLVQASTLSCVCNAEFHSKDRVKDKGLIFHIFLKASRREDLSRSNPSQTWVARRTNTLLSTTEPLQNSSTKSPSHRKASNGNDCCFASQSIRTRENPAGSQTRLAPFLPGLAAKVTERCKVSPYNLPSLPIQDTNFSSAKHCYF